MSKLNKERIEWLNYAAKGLAANGSEMAMSPQDVIALTEYCLAALDSEPVAVIDQANLDYLRSGADADVWPPEREEMGDVLLYRHAQPALEMPEIDRQAIADKVYGKCSRIPGATFYNAVEFAIDEMEACCAAMLQAGNSPVNDVTAGKPLTITLPDISSKAFWSGSGKNEVFHPETYKRWTKEAIERYCAIARIEVEVR